MGSLMHKILKKAQPFRIVSSLNNHPSPNLAPLISPDQPISTQGKLDGSRAQTRLSIVDLTGIDESKPSNFLPIFPNFPYGYFLDPIYSTGLHRSNEEEDEVKGVQSDETTIWADSVKKKRKRKMNKHKYRKLRKRLRRKTKT